MDSIRRRIVAVAAHRSRTGLCPTAIHSLGAGDSAEIRPTRDGFVDLASGLEAKVGPSEVTISDATRPIELTLEGDVGFAAYDPATDERFTGRCGGGASVTVYDAHSTDFFQYAVTTSKT
jgi:hypothetical protein